MEAVIDRILKLGAIATVAALLSMNTATQAVAAPGDLPNIVFILSDDVGYGDIGPYKSATSPIPTPNIDALANQGMTFTNAHTPASVCAPTRYSALTGNYTFRGKNKWGIWVYNYESMILPGQKTIGDVLKAAGYNTGYVGKMHLGGDFYEKNSNNFYRGNDASQVDFSRQFRNGLLDHGFNYTFVAPNGLQFEPYAFFENDKFLPINPNQSDIVYLTAGTNGNSIIPDSGYGDPNWDSSQLGPKFVQKAINFIDQHHTQYGTQKPFFLYYATEAIHEPNTPPPFMNGAPVKGVTGYDAKADMIYELDLQVGQIINALQQRGLANDTLIILTSDNGGTNTAAHLNIGHNSVGGLRGRKTLIYQGGLQVPFIAKWGNGTAAGSMIKPGTVSSQLISIQDWVSAMHHLVGQPIAPDQALDSVNILPIMLGQQPASVAVRDELIIESAHWGDNAYYRGIRMGDWVLIVNATDTPVELYNLANDRQQKTNLINNSAQASRVSTMLARFNYVTTQSTRTVPIDSTDCGPPTYDSTTQAAVFIWKDCGTGQWNVRMTAGTGYLTYKGSVVSDQPFNSVTGVSIESNDTFNTSNPNIISYNLLMHLYEDGFNFQYPASANVCFGVSAPSNVTVLMGSAKTPVSVPFNMETLAPCGTTTLPTVSINNVSVAETAGNATFTVSLSQASTQTISVQVATANVSATAGQDYTAVSQTLTFNPGQTSKTVSVGILNDTTTEGTETFSVALSNPTNATLGSATGTGTITESLISPCGQPSYNPNTDRAVLLWKDCVANVWRVRFTAGGSYANYVGKLTSDQVFNGVTRVGLESTDVVNYTTNPRIISFNVALSSYDDGFDFGFPASASVCLSMTKTSNAKFLLGVGRTPIRLPFNLKTLGPC